MTTINIHEFSIGIKVIGDPGNWRSAGFDGYMNKTLDKVPDAVQDAISDGLLEAAEGSAQQAEQNAQAAGKNTVEPGIIGREIKQVKDRDSGWSVIAVITSAKDKEGRPFAVYRYFLTPGIGNLRTLLNWYILKAKRPVFNPFDTKQVGKFYQYETHKNNGAGDPLSKQEFKDLLASSEEIITIPHNSKCAPIIIHELASRRKKNNELISWAYKVEGLEKPWSFQAIYPASETAEKTIKKQIKKGENIAPIVVGDYKVKKYIGNLISEGVVKENYMKKIENTLHLSDIYTDKAWEDSIFKPLGIKDAKDPENGDIKNPSLIRLHELYGLNVYRKLPDFLKWLKLDEFSQPNDLEKEHYKIAAELSRDIQEKINQSPTSFKAIEFKASQGINYIIPNLVSKESSDGIKFTQETRRKLLNNWLTLDNGGLWKTVYQKYYLQLWNDIVQIAKNYMTARNALIEAYAKIKSANSLSSESNIKNMLEDEISQSGSSNNKQQTMTVISEMSTSNSTDITTHNDSHPKDSYELRYAYKNLQILGKNYWKSITEDIVKLIWYGRSPRKSNYSYLAEFFENVGELFEDREDRTNSNSNYYLSALFYKIATDEVPTPIWKKCKLPGKYETTYKLINIPNSPTIELSRRLLWWEPIIAFIIKLLIIFYKFWSQPYTPKEDEKKTGKVVLLRYLIIIIVTIILLDGFKFSPIKIGQNALTNTKNWIAKQLDPDSALTEEDKETYRTTTVPALNQIVNDFVKYGKPREKVNSESFDKTIVSKAVIGIVNNPESDFQLVFSTKNTRGEKSKWFTAIQEYQTRVSNQEPPIILETDGIIERGKDTDKRLRCDVINNLKLEFNKNKISECDKYGVDLTNEKQILPTDSPEVQNWNKNIESLEALVTEFKTNHKFISEYNLQKKISELLTQNTQDYDQIAQIDPTNINSDRTVLIEGIKKYQASKGAKQPDGVIDKDGGTYNHLKCDIAKGLGITLNFPPDQCK